MEAEEWLEAMDMVEKMLSGKGIDDEIARQAGGVIEVGRIVRKAIDEVRERGIRPELSSADVGAIVEAARKDGGVARAGRGIAAYVAIKNGDLNNPKLLDPLRQIQPGDTAGALEAFSDVLGSRIGTMQPEEAARMLVALAAKSDGGRGLAFENLERLKPEKREEVLTMMDGLAKQMHLTPAEAGLYRRFQMAAPDHRFED